MIHADIHQALLLLAAQPGQLPLQVQLELVKVLYEKCRFPAVQQQANIPEVGLLLLRCCASTEPAQRLACEWLADACLLESRRHSNSQVTVFVCVEGGAKGTEAARPCNVPGVLI